MPQNFVREFRQQFAAARALTKATFLACYSGFAAVYVGWSVLPDLNVVDTTALVIVGAMFGYSAYAVAWCLARMEEADSRQFLPVPQGVPMQAVKASPFGTDASEEDHREPGRAIAA